MGGAGARPDPGRLPRRHLRPSRLRAEPQPGSGYDYDTLSADLDTLLRGLDLTDAARRLLDGRRRGRPLLGSFGSERIHSAVFAAAVPPFLYKSDDNPDGGLDDATIEGFESGVKTDRLAFVETFVDSFTTAGDRSDLVSEPAKRFLWNIASAASPKATLDCIAAFGRTDFRDDLAKIDVPVLVIHGDSDGVVPFEISGKRTAESVQDRDAARRRGRAARHQRLAPGGVQPGADRVPGPLIGKQA